MKTSIDTVTDIIVIIWPHRIARLLQAYKLYYAITSFEC